MTLNEISAVSTEYVELVNASATTQSIAGYRVADADADGGPRFAEASVFAVGAALGPGERIVTVGGFATPATGPQTACLPSLATCYQAAWDISGSNGETMFLLSPDDVIVDQATYPDEASRAELEPPPGRKRRLRRRGGHAWASQRLALIRTRGRAVVHLRPWTSRAMGCSSEPRR